MRKATFSPTERLPSFSRLGIEGYKKHSFIMYHLPQVFVNNELTTREADQSVEQAITR